MKPDPPRADPDLPRWRWRHPRPVLVLGALLVFWLGVLAVVPPVPTGTSVMVVSLGAFLGLCGLTDRGDWEPWKGLFFPLILTLGYAWFWKGFLAWPLSALLPAPMNEPLNAALLSAVVMASLTALLEMRRSRLFVEAI